MVLIYVKSGEWKSSISDQWSFVIEKERRGRMVTLETTTLLENLKIMVCEDYGMDPNVVNAEFSYEMVNQGGNPPIILSNDRQVSNFVGCVKKGLSTCLCVTFSGTNQKDRVNIDLNKEPCDSSYVEEDEFRELNRPPFVKPSQESREKRKKNIFDDNGCGEANGDSEKEGRLVVDLVKKDQIFTDKSVLKATIEICAMKNNFDYSVHKSTKKWWYIRCKDSLCNWSLRAECLDESTYFMINKCVARHTCASSSKTNFGKTASAKTIGNLIKHQYEGSNEGPKGNDIIQFMRSEYGCEINYSHAWEAREFAIAAVRGIPDKSYGKIPSYLHMIKEANPGTHTHYETDDDGRFKYLFLSFGQSIRGFYNAIRRVIVVDGTFLKNKYKGVLLVATALDGNSNLYPIAFGVVDSENDNSWEWFLRQLNFVICDDKGLAFVSDRSSSIAKALGKVYPQSTHGICIHHLLNNVVKFFKARGLVSLIERASRSYRFTEFQERFAEIFSMSHAVGKYLQDADVRKWVRCLFPGFRYDIRTNNPAESINSVLRSPREFPVIPLLDSIRELMTRWFYERRLLSLKQIDPLTIKVEKKIDRRIEKAKGFQVYKASWRNAYAESINPISIVETEWNVPEAVKLAKVLPPESRRGAGRRRKRRYETVEDKIRSSQGSQRGKKHKCSRCGNEGHKRGTCDIPI